MRTAVVAAFERPLTLEERIVPQPGPGEVLVQMETSGLCHTDIHTARGDCPVKPTVPFIPGHEHLGIVIALGAGVTNPRLGERVAIPWLSWACDEFEWCIDGHQVDTGYGRDGTYSELVVASAKYVVAVPHGIPRR